MPQGCTCMYVTQASPTLLVSDSVGTTSI